MKNIYLTKKNANGAQQKNNDVPKFKFISKSFLLTFFKSLDTEHTCYLQCFHARSGPPGPTG